MKPRELEREGKDSLSAIVACYMDGQAIPVMYERLKAVFLRLRIDYEIIFVNDGSPDNSGEVIRQISRRDRRVLGVTHSRNFGAQAAMLSGMEMATKGAVVLLDGDLQDPPEVIEQFVARWREGYDVVYGQRVRREGSIFMQVSYKLFYRLFDLMSYLSIPHDAGDFSLMDRKVVECLLRFPERDLFIRGLRAFVGFRQVGVPYARPKRMFGKTTNSLARNIGWAKKAVFSFSYLPLNAISLFGAALLLLSVLLCVFQVAAMVFAPSLAAGGAAPILLAVLFLGSVNLFALAVLGEYIGRSFEELKQRPLFIRRNLIRNGKEEEPTPGNMTRGKFPLTACVNPPNGLRTRTGRHARR